MKILDQFLSVAAYLSGYRQGCVPTDLEDTLAQDIQAIERSYRGHFKGFQDQLSRAKARLEGCGGLLDKLGKSDDPQSFKLMGERHLIAEHLQSVSNSLENAGGYLVDIARDFENIEEHDPAEAKGLQGQFLTGDGVTLYDVLESLKAEGRRLSDDYMQVLESDEAHVYFAGFNANPEYDDQPEARSADVDLILDFLPQ